MSPAIRRTRHLSGDLDALVADIRACRRCRDHPDGVALPHEPRPVLRVSTTARIGVFGQAPGTRVHASGQPFTDSSGVRLRAWMGVTDEEFYDATRIAIVPMGFCFPGLDAKGGDLPPRRECAPLWRARLMAALPNLELILLVGQYAQRWHLGADGRAGLTDTVRRWREIAGRPGHPVMVPLPHPSWRNNGWIKRNPWFDAELLPWLRDTLRELLLPPSPKPPATGAGVPPRRP
jgi:uracil-DNA glycosylase